MTPDEVVKVLNEMGRTSKEEEVDSWYVFPERIKAILFAITLLQDYQKLREKISVEKILDITKTCKTSLSGLRTLEDIAQAIVTYLQ